MPANRTRIALIAAGLVLVVAVFVGFALFAPAPTAVSTGGATAMNGSNSTNTTTATVSMNDTRPANRSAPGNASNATR